MSTKTALDAHVARLVVSGVCPPAAAPVDRASSSSLVVGRSRLLRRRGAKHERGITKGHAGGVLGIGADIDYSLEEVLTRVLEAQIGIPVGAQL